MAENTQTASRVAFACPSPRRGGSLGACAGRGAWGAPVWSTLILSDQPACEPVAVKVDFRGGQGRGQESTELGLELGGNDTQAGGAEPTPTYTGSDRDTSLTLSEGSLGTGLSRLRRVQRRRVDQTPSPGS